MHNVDSYQPSRVVSDNLMNKKPSRNHIKNFTILGDKPRVFRPQPGEILLYRNGLLVFGVGDQQPGVKNKINLKGTNFY